MKELVGNWDFLIQEEFYKPYMYEISKQFDKSKASLFDSVYPGKTNEEVFKIFKERKVEEIKVLYIVDSLNYDLEPVLTEMEKVFGLALNITVQEDLKWIEKQGVMVFPRALTHGDIGVHDYWNTFTDEVLVKLLGWNSNIIVMTNNVLIKNMLKELNPLVTVISNSDWEYIHTKTNIKLNERVI